MERLRQITMGGTRREIGLFQGRRVRDLRLPPLAAGDHAFGDACRAMVERWHPAIIGEFDGMLEASGLPEDRFTSYYYGRTAPLAGGCTNIAASAEAAAGGTTLVACNYDWAYADLRWCEARLVAPAGEPRRIGYTHHWGGVCDVMNEEGLTVCIASLPPIKPTGPGLQWHIVVDLVVSRCRTASEAAHLICGVPHVRSLSYLIADATTARLVEASAARAAIVEPQAGILVATNHRLGEEEDAGARGSFSVVRRRRALELLRPVVGRIGPEDLRRVLADHEGGICAGDHDDIRGRPSQHGRSGTIWSLLAAPAERTMQVAPGHPCTTPFERLPWPPA